MLSRLPRLSQITTIDIVPWKRLSDSYLRDSDFEEGRLRQLVFNPGSPPAANEHAFLFREADLIYIDAAKDGVFERSLLANFNSMGLKQGTLLVFDDIRFWSMLEIWREITLPKLDLTSFGSWRGTGLVDWQGKTAE